MMATHYEMLVYTEGGKPEVLGAKGERRSNVEEVT